MGVVSFCDWNSFYVYVLSDIVLDSVAAMLSSVDVQ